MNGLFHFISIFLMLREGKGKERKGKKTYMDICIDGWMDG